MSLSKGCDAKKRVCPGEWRCAPIAFAPGSYPQREWEGLHSGGTGFIVLEKLSGDEEKAWRISLTGLPEEHQEELWSVFWINQGKIQRIVKSASEIECCKIVVRVC